MALVPTALTTWFRANAATVDAGKGTITWASAGLPETVVHAVAAATGPAEARLVAAHLPSEPHLTFKLAPGGKVGFSSGLQPKTLAEIEAVLDAARRAEEATHTRFGSLAETKVAVQCAVMWQLIYSPLEAGPFAPVIRGNPWGLDKGVVNDDWAYVIFE